MIQIRRSEERGHAEHGWLRSRHTFSFADYYDPKNMGFSVLRVINEDKIAGGTGFGTHPHRDMEIITYVIEGALEHKDSMGNTAVIRPGEVQTMSAGTGITHSEFNHFKNQQCHLLQIWILPRKMNIVPSYGQKSFEQKISEKNLALVVSADARDGSIAINQDVDIFVGKFKTPTKMDFEIKPKRNVWIQLIAGELQVNSETLRAGDAVASSQEKLLKLDAQKDSHFLLFDLP